MSLSCHSLLQSPPPHLLSTCVCLCTPTGEAQCRHPSGGTDTFSDVAKPPQQEDKQTRTRRSPHARALDCISSFHPTTWHGTASAYSAAASKERIPAATTMYREEAHVRAQTHHRTHASRRSSSERENKTTTTKKKREAEEKAQMCGIRRSNPHSHTRNHHRSQHRRRKETTHVAQHTVARRKGLKINQ